MKENTIEIFQKSVRSLTMRNRNLLDILTKCSVSCAKMCRSATKAATSCGCIGISGKKQSLSFSPAGTCAQDCGVSGILCNECKSTLEGEIGESIFYIAAMCNALEISLPDVLEREIKNVETLGKYSLH